MYEIFVQKKKQKKRKYIWYASDNKQYISLNQFKEKNKKKSNISVNALLIGK